MSADTPLQLRMRVLQLRMEYLSGTARSQEAEEKLLAELESAVRKLEAGPISAFGGTPEPGSERRAEPRSSVAFPVVLRLVRSDGSRHRNLSIARDIARQGLSVVASFEPPVGERVSVDLGLPGAIRVAGIPAEVRWKTAVWTHPGHFVLGLRFLSLPDSAKAALSTLGL